MFFCSAAQKAEAGASLGNMRALTQNSRNSLVSFTCTCACMHVNPSTCAQTYLHALACLNYSFWVFFSPPHPSYAFFLPHFLLSFPPCTPGHYSLSLLLHLVALAEAPHSSETAFLYCPH